VTGAGPVATLLLHGTYESLSLGMDESAVLARHGPPPDVARASSDCRILRYGRLQLTITGGALTMISVELLEDDGDSGEDISRETTPYEVMRLARAAGVVCEIEPKLTFNAQLCLRTSAGALALFDLEHEDLQSVMIAETY
jgi:hypothetical protein